jgi:hypothetical protein
LRCTAAPSSPQTAVANRGEPFKSAISDTAPGALKALARMFGFECTVEARAREMAAHFYGDTVPWEDAPATVTTCFAYATWDKPAPGGGGSGAAS